MITFGSRILYVLRITDHVLVVATLVVFVLVLFLVVVVDVRIAIRLVVISLAIFELLMAAVLMIFLLVPVVLRLVVLLILERSSRVGLTSRSVLMPHVLLFVFRLIMVGGSLLDVSLNLTELVGPVVQLLRGIRRRRRRRYGRQSPPLLIRCRAHSFLAFGRDELLKQRLLRGGLADLGLDDDAVLLDGGDEGGRGDDAALVTSRVFLRLLGRAGSASHAAPAVAVVVEIRATRVVVVVPYTELFCQ